MVKEYLKKHSNYYVANGDIIQIAPIESEYFNKSIDSKRYYKAILDELFPHQILLLEPKRYDEEGKIKVKEFKKDVFIHNMSASNIIKKYCKSVELDDITKNSICVTYTNNSRRVTNNKLHFKNFDKAYFNGCKIKANQRMIVNKKSVIHKNLSI